MCCGAPEREQLLGVFPTLDVCEEGRMDLILVVTNSFQIGHGEPRVTDYSSAAHTFVMGCRKWTPDELAANCDKEARCRYHSWTEERGGNRRVRTKKWPAEKIFGLCTWKSVVPYMGSFCAFLMYMTLASEAEMPWP